MKLAARYHCTTAKLCRHKDEAEGIDQLQSFTVGLFAKLTATMIAGLAASLAGTEMNIWVPVGFVPKPVTCCRAPKAELAEASRLIAVVKAFMLIQS
jgi:hypothetical protein